MRIESNRNVPQTNRLSLGVLDRMGRAYFKSSIRVQSTSARACPLPSLDRMLAMNITSGTKSYNFLSLLLISCSSAQVIF